MRLVGTIVKPQGVKGELKIYPADTNLEIYKNIKHLYVDNVKVNVKKIVGRQRFLYVFLEGVNDRNMADNYRQKKVYADDDELSLKEDMYYVEDLLDMDVVSQEGEFLGTIIDIQSYGATDVFTILDMDNREIMLPHLKSIFLGVINNKMQVNKKLFEEMKLCTE